MANVTVNPTPIRQQSLEQTGTATLEPRFRYARWIATSILALIVALGLFILVVWLVLKPKALEFSVQDGHVHGFNISRDDHLNATFEFVVRLYNPNGRVAIYYDRIESRVVYDDQILAFNAHDRLFQPHRSETRLSLRLAASSVALLGTVPGDLRVEKSSGEIEVSVWLKARIRFKVGRWKSSRRTMKVFCSPVLVHFSRSKPFQRTPCAVEL